MFRIEICLDRSSPRSLGLHRGCADSESSATWPASRPGASSVKSIPCRAELEFSRGPFEAHGLFRPGQVHPVRRKPPTVPLARIRIPDRIRILRQLDVWRSAPGPQRIRHEPGHAPFRSPCRQRPPAVFRIRVRLHRQRGMAAHDPASTKIPATFIRPSLRSDLMSAVRTG